MNFKLRNLMSMNSKLVNLKLVVFLYFLVLFNPLYSFCAILYLCKIVRNTQRELEMIKEYSYAICSIYF